MATEPVTAASLSKEPSIAQPAVPIPKDYSQAGHKDPNHGSRAARLREIADALNSESGPESANAQLNRLNAERESAQGSQADKKSKERWGRVEGKTKADQEGAEAATRIEAAEDAEEAAVAAEEAEANGTEESAETPATEATDKPEDKLSAMEKDRKARFDKTLKLQARAREQAERVRQAETKLLAKHEELTNKEADIKSRIESAERRAQLAERVLNLATENPLELLERAGVPPEKVAQWIQEAGDPAKQETATIRKDIESLKSQLEKERAQMAQERQKEQLTAKQKQIEHEFLSEFDRDESKYEASHLMFTKAERVAQGNKIADMAAKKGVSFTLSDIADAVNEVAKREDRWVKLQKKIKDVEAKAKPAVPVKSGLEGAATRAAAPRPAPRVFATNRLTQQSGDGSNKKPLTTAQERKIRLQRMYLELDAGKR